MMRSEEGSTRTLCLRWAHSQKIVLLLVFFVFVICCIVCWTPRTEQCHLKPTEQDIAELHLNYTGPRQDPRLLWKGDPALGRSFLHGPQLDNGQLRIQRDGIYRFHIQVTLANCTFSSKNTEAQRAILAVGICSPTTHSITLLRRNFHLSCTVASQRLTPLVHGDTLCTNLTLPLEPSQNADETFFGVHWVHP
ncbi:CD70 antigen isoform X1 [Phyllostomus hastatus]|uniref:CD70 antigen isoform X1 n=1 Tax=Phyllostomus hastatus TaxID=9423 RepID=UPI001E682662|nr:CD70 antigen isoform X1 [Phyllostomus hastatus]